MFCILYLSVVMIECMWISFVNFASDINILLKLNSAIIFQPSGSDVKPLNLDQRPKDIIKTSEFLSFFLRSNALYCCLILFDLFERLS